MNNFEITLYYRHDGVSSFIASDYDQVDFNVSRHLSFELKQTDWNLMILHYLGLDHVGNIFFLHKSLLLIFFKKLIYIFYHKVISKDLLLLCQLKENSMKWT